MGILFEIVVQHQAEQEREARTAEAANRGSALAEVVDAHAIKTEEALQVKEETIC